MTTGLNAPADMRLPAQFFDLNKSQWTRVVLKPEYDLTPWVETHHNLGMSVLGVIARESLYGASDATAVYNSGDEYNSGVKYSEPMSYDEAARFYAARYGDTLDALQCGNEADHKSPSSWSMEPADLNALLAAFNQHFPDATIVGPGLVSGQPGYLDAVDLDLMDYIAVHPYGQRPDNTGDWSELPGNFGTVGALLDSYRYHGKPMWVTEIGVSTEQVTPEFQARYCEAILKTLNLRTDVPVAMWFCADDAMVPEFGLYDLNGNPKPSAPAFMKVADGGHAPVNQYEFVLGFKKWHDLEPGLIGDALANERNTGFHGWQIQPTSTGVIQWHEDDGHIFVTRDGRVFRWTEDLTSSIEVYE